MEKQRIKTKRRKNEHIDYHKKKNRELVVVAYSFVVIFVCMIGYFAYFQFYKSEEFIIEENAKTAQAKSKIEAIRKKEMPGIVVALEDLQEFSGNRIRFDANQTLGI